MYAGTVVPRRSPAAARDGRPVSWGERKARVVGSGSCRERRARRGAPARRRPVGAACVRGRPHRGRRSRRRHVRRRLAAAPCRRPGEGAPALADAGAPGLRPLRSRRRDGVRLVGDAAPARAQPRRGARQGGCRPRSGELVGAADHVRDGARARTPPSPVAAAAPLGVGRDRRDAAAPRRPRGRPRTQRRARRPGEQPRGCPSASPQRGSCSATAVPTGSPAPAPVRHPPAAAGVAAEAARACVADPRHRRRA